MIYFGGPVSAPGYEFHQLAGRAGLSQRLEWRLPVPFVALPLGRFGKVPGSATLAPALPRSWSSLAALPRLQLLWITSRQRTYFKDAEGV